MVEKIDKENDISWDIETDVAVVGGGACGLIASLAAAEKGVEVLLFEKEKKLGGNTSLSQGMIPAAGTRFQKAGRIDDSPELMAEDIFKKNDYESDPEMTLHLCREAKNLVEWLVDSVGIHLDIVTDFIYPGQSRHRIHAPSTRKGTQIVNELRTILSSRENILLAQATPVRDLVALEQDGRVIGLKAETNRAEDEPHSGPESHSRLQWFWTEHGDVEENISLRWRRPSTLATKETRERGSSGEWNWALTPGTWELTRHTGQWPIPMPPFSPGPSLPMGAFR